MILSATGHRPDKLGGYAPWVDEKLRRLARVIIETCEPVEVISGMALGWDMAWAEAAIELGVPMCAALPFDSQTSRWPESSQRRHAEILSRASRVITVCLPGYSPLKMQIRNEWMVNNSDMIVALWNGTTGGTYNCVKYANKRSKPVFNAWSLY